MTAVRPKKALARQNADMTVLVADDSHAMREFISAILRDQGVGHVRTAGDGAAALEAMKASPRPIDLLISDLAMPGMDGVELLREVGKHNPGLAVLTISSLDARLRFAVSEMAQRMGLQVLGLLGKPFTEADIEAALTRFHEERLKAAEGGVGGEMSDQEIDAAINSKGVVVHYQPKVRIDSSHVVGVEALVRLNDPRRGLVSPDKFIGATEARGQIENLTYQVIDIALRDAGGWAREGLRLNVGINISSSAIARLDLPEYVESVARQHGLSPSQITLEITETELANAVELLDVCARFRMRGFGLAIDDFGTGESGLPRLRSLPFTELKIDQRYVVGAAEDDELKAILQSSIELGKRLSMTVVAEGVQRVPDWELLEDLGCDVAQGFLVSRPLPHHKVMRWALRWERLGAK